MRKYNMCNESNVNSCSNRNRAIPLFDIPCLYYPQYPSNWGTSNCQKDYAIFCITSIDDNDRNLELNPQVIDGRSIQLDSDGETLILQPGKLYELNYQVTALIGNDLTVIPVVDSISDLCNAATITTATSTGSTQTLSASLMLPVVETPSTLQLQVQSSSNAVEQPHGSVSIVALAEL